MNKFSRRKFIKTSAVVTLGTAATGASLAAILMKKGNIVIVILPEDKITTSIPATWAVNELKTAIEKQGSDVKIAESFDETGKNDFCIYVSGFNSEYAREIFSKEQIEPYTEAESLCIVQSKIDNRSVLFAGGVDNPGLVYALTEIADRVNCLKTDRQALEFKTPETERPASRVRSMTRNFSSEMEDKPLFYDKKYWIGYLDMLAYSRINRFSFATGMAYNAVQRISDGYFLFPFPFLFDVPGYNVTARGLPIEERAKNFEMLRFIGEETAKRGLQFQFGIWTLAYKWEESENTSYQIEGLTDDTHAAYCHDALALLLREIPAITGITLRVHYESGIRGGENEFWSKQFDAIANCGRRIEIDMHGKDMDENDLNSAIDTKQPVVVSPKFCGEHMSLPYHQASIRELERAPSDNLTDTGKGLLKGNRRFTRYGYADYLLENRNWDVLFRIWPGTQRFLLSGDPILFAGYGRTASFCGAMGFELCEPLHFKGRRGTGAEGGRCGYLDNSLKPRYDYQKYEYFYRLWGRMGYNPDAKPEVWRRAFTKDFGRAALPVEKALGRVSAALPLFYLSHAVSANCTVYLPELYTNSYIAKDQDWPYDTEPPKVFGNISPADPQLFQSPNECGEALLEQVSTGKYTPVEVAHWLEEMAESASDNIQEANKLMGSEASNPNFRRVEEDVLILIGLARFFAAKMRCGVAWQIFNLSGELKAAETAIEIYTKGRDAWAKMAKRAEGVYRKDISYGPRGHWIDRLPSFDEDIADLQKRMQTPVNQGKQYHTETIQKAIDYTRSKPLRPGVNASHQPAASLTGHPLKIRISLTGEKQKVKLFYRHVNQAEQWQSLVLEQTGNNFEGVIPGEYCQKRFSIQYYFEIHTDNHSVARHPELSDDLDNVPYFVVNKTIKTK